MFTIVLELREGRDGGNLEMLLHQVEAVPEVESVTYTGADRCINIHMEPVLDAVCDVQRLVAAFNFPRAFDLRRSPTQQPMCTGRSGP